MEVVPGVLRHDTLQVREGCVVVSHRGRRQSTAVIRVQRVGTRRDDTIVQLARTRELAVLEVQIGKLLEVTDRRLSMTIASSSRIRRRRGNTRNEPRRRPASGTTSIAI
jgi:hypothetical protein